MLLLCQPAVPAAPTSWLSKTRLDTLGAWSTGGTLQLPLRWLRDCMLRSHGAGKWVRAESQDWTAGMTLKPKGGLGFQMWAPAKASRFPRASWESSSYCVW